MSNDSFKKIDMHRIDMTKIVEQMPQINIVNPLESVMSDHQKNMDSIYKAIRQANEEKAIKEFKKEEREIESLSLQKQTLEETTIIREVLEKRLGSIDHTLDLIINAIGRESQNAHRDNLEMFRQLHELKTIMESSASDKESKIKSFFGKLTGDVAVMMFVEYLKLLYFPAK